jgi:glycine oxidase
MVTPMAAEPSNAARPKGEVRDREEFAIGGGRFTTTLDALSSRSRSPLSCYGPGVRVAIVGGGVMGCATALAIAERGAQAVVLERAVPGAEASSAAAGILGAQAELHGPLREPNAAIFPRARAAWGPWSQELREATGIDVGHRVSGVLRVAFAEAERENLADDVAWQQSRGLRASLLDTAEVLAIEPQITPEVLAAAYFPDDGQVDPPALLRALVVAAARNARITIQSGTTVQKLLVEDQRCVGVALDAGNLRADAVVLAAGSWSSLVPGVPSSLPAVKPVRGQMVLLDERPPRLRAIVFGASAYVVPRGDGRVVCGSTMENAGFRKEVTAGGLEAILSGSLACVPSLGAAQFTSAWSNFRPHVEGDAPLIGASPLPGLFLATGHHRNGILLSKVTADAVARAILG